MATVIEIFKMLFPVVTFVTGVIKIIEFTQKIKKEKVMTVLKTTFSNPLGKILIWSIGLTAFIYFFPWSKFHYGDTPPQKIVYITKPVPVDKPIVDTNPKTKISSKKSTPIQTEKPKHIKKEQPTDDTKNQPREDISVKVDRSPGAHIAGGKANVAINGDVYINADRKLTAYGLNAIDKSIDSMRQIHNVPKYIIISTYSYFNTPLIMEQLKNHFEEQGFTVNISGSIMANGPLVIGYKISWDIDGSAVGIELGYFK